METFQRNNKSKRKKNTIFQSIYNKVEKKNCTAISITKISKCLICIMKRTRTTTGRVFLSSIRVAITRISISCQLSSIIGTHSTLILTNLWKIEHFEHICNSCKNYKNIPCKTIPVYQFILYIFIFHHFF